MVEIDNEMIGLYHLTWFYFGTRHKVHPSIIHGSSVDEVCPLETTILLLFFQSVLKFLM